MARLLAVEDDLVDRKLAFGLLRERGHEVILAGSGAEGWEVLWECRPELVLCELWMPGLDGHALAGLVKGSAEFRQIPLLVTGHSPSSLSAEASSAVSARVRRGDHQAPQ